MRQQPEVVLGAPHVGDCERSFPARLDRALCFRKRALRVEIGVIDAGCLVDDHLSPLVGYPMPTVGCRGIEVEDEWWIHLARHAAAVFWFNGNEQVPVLILDACAQQVANLQCGNGCRRVLWPRLRPVNVLSATSENEAEQKRRERRDRRFGGFNRTFAPNGHCQAAWSRSGSVLAGMLI